MGGAAIDVVIRGGRVVDGVGAVNAVADVGIEDGRIVAVGDSLGRARTEIDARGKIVAPGFIDAHTHSDFTLPLRPSAEAKLLQGVTTDVTGNCGLSPFPFANDVDGLGHGSFFEPALDRRWESVAAYRHDVDELHPGINIAPLVGLGAVRLAVMGHAQRDPSDAEVAEMRRLVNGASADGVFGVSTGLVYPPGSYADRSEIASVVSAAGAGVYSTHIRDEGDELVAAVDEALEIGARCECAVHISHHKALGRRNWGLPAETLGRIDEAYRDGLDVTVDVYPYTAGSTTLITLVPTDDLAGGEEALRGRLADAEQRARIAAAVESHAQFSLDDVVLADVPSRAELAGRRLVPVAGEEGCSPAELVLRLLEADGSLVVMLGFGISEDDMRTILRHPRAMIGSDGWLMGTDGVGYAHPRHFGCTARVLTRYVRDEHVLSLEEAIERLAAWPAARFGLADRGVLREGAVADVAVFDLDGMEERATFEHPCTYPLGFEYVLVGGQLAVAEGHPTGVRNGRVLASSRDGRPSIDSLGKRRKRRQPSARGTSAGRLASEAAPPGAPKGKETR